MSALRILTAAAFLWIAVSVGGAAMDAPAEARRTGAIIAAIFLVGAANLLLASECRCPRKPTDGATVGEKSPK